MMSSPSLETLDRAADCRDDHKTVSTKAEGSTIEAANYTVFTRVERWLITIIMGVAMLFSPLTANIYFPAILSLSRAMNVTLQQVNLTITAYIVLQGIAPLFVGDLADKIGRRPVYLLTFAIYIVTSLGLAINKNSYAVLLSLRMLQSAGCSATAAISYGVLADVAPPAKRGHMLGAAMVAANTGPTIGPLLGGIISNRAGWHWIFCFLTVIGASFLVVLFVLFPETSRKIVNNGHLMAPRWNRPMLSWVRHYPANALGSPRHTRFTGTKSRSTVPNPIPALRIVLYRDASLVLWVSAVHYMAYYCLQATMPGLFVEGYGLNELQLGLTYLAIGTGVALGGFLNGRFLDINYRRTAKDVGFTINKISGDNMSTFPIEKARTRFAYVLILLDAITLSGYGWACRAKTHIALPITFQFILGFLQTCIVQTFNTLLVDIFPQNPSTASASGNITRCALSAAGIAAVQPLLDTLGFGWVFTILAGLVGITSIIATYLIISHGMSWRSRRLA
jgi:multidrug resistance protein